MSSSVSPRCMLALGATLALVGCPGRVEDPGALVGPLDCVDYAPIYLQTNCGGSGCHSVADTESEIDLESEGVAERLIGVPGGGGNECEEEDGLLINPDALEESLIFTKMQAEPPCGDRMPLFDRPATENDLECLMEWMVAVTSDDPPDEEVEE